MAPLRILMLLIFTDATFRAAMSFRDAAYCLRQLAYDTICSDAAMPRQRYASYALIAMPPRFATMRHTPLDITPLMPLRSHMPKMP